MVEVVVVVEGQANFWVDRVKGTELVVVVVVVKIKMKNLKRKV